MASFAVYTPFEVEEEEAEYVKANFPELWVTIQKELPGLSEEQCTIVASLVLNVCRGCFASGTGCFCWNDD